MCHKTGKKGEEATEPKARMSGSKGERERKRKEIEKGKNSVLHTWGGRRGRVIVHSLFFFFLSSSPSIWEPSLRAQRRKRKTRAAPSMGCPSAPPPCKAGARRWRCVGVCKRAKDIKVLSSSSSKTSTTMISRLPHLSFLPLPPTTQTERPSSSLARW